MTELGRQEKIGLFIVAMALLALLSNISGHLSDINDNLHEIAFQTERIANETGRLK